MATARPLCGGGCEPCCSRPAHNLLIQLVHLQVSSFRYVLFSKNALGLHCRLSGVGQSQKRRKKGKKKRVGVGETRTGGNISVQHLEEQITTRGPGQGGGRSAGWRLLGGPHRAAPSQGPLGLGRRGHATRAPSFPATPGAACTLPTSRGARQPPSSRRVMGTASTHRPARGTLPASLQPPGCSRRMRLMQPPRNRGPRGHARQAVLATGPDPAHGATLPPSLDSNPVALQPWPSGTATLHSGRPLPEATMGTPPLPPPCR